MGDRTPRLLVDALPAAAGEVLLPEASARHARVLRLRAGDTVELFDGRGGLAVGQVAEVAKTTLRCQLAAPTVVPPPSPALTLIVGVTKGAKLDLVVRMATELGVDAIGLAQCARSVPEPRDPEGRRARLARISLEACGQSGRLRPVALEGPTPLLELAARAPAGAARVAFYERSQAPLSVPDANAPACVVIGPEGGLAPDEVAGLRGLDYQLAAMGPQILRAETAAITAATLLLDRLGRLEPVG